MSIFMYCKKCGAGPPDNAAFCKICEEATGANNTAGAVCSIGTADAGSVSGDSEKGKRKKEKRHWFWKILLAVLLLFAAYVILNSQFCLGIWIPREEDGDEDYSVIVGSGEGTVYELSDGEIQKDEATGITYVNDIVIIFFEKDVSTEMKQEIVDSIGGEIAGEIPAVNQYQVRIGAHSYEELNRICDELESMRGVDYAYVDIAFELIR